MSTLPAINSCPAVMPKQNINIKNQQFAYAPQSVDSIQKIERSIPKEEMPGRMLLSLMKSALSGEKADPKLFAGCTEQDWIKMYNLSHDNAVTQLAFDGIKNSEGINVPEECIKNMEINQKFVKRNHNMQEKFLGEFSDFTASHGYDTVQMKGIGFSMNYPDPEKRFGGDIDVVNIKKGSTPEESMKQSSFEVDKLAEEFSRKELKTDKTAKPTFLVDYDHGIKHSIVRYKGMPIENHRTFLNIENGVPMFKKMDDYLLKHLNPVEQILPNGTKIKVPSKEFNTVFVAFHAMVHFGGGNVNFHHLADWAVHVNKNGLKVPEEAKGTVFEKFMYAFTNIANKHLGTNIKVPENPEMEAAILKQMLYPGESIIKKPTTKNPLKIVAYKFKSIKAGVDRRNQLYGEGAASMKEILTKVMINKIKHPLSIVRTLTKV